MSGRADFWPFPELWEAVRTTTWGPEVILWTSLPLTPVVKFFFSDYKSNICSLEIIWQCLLFQAFKPNRRIGRDFADYLMQCHPYSWDNRLRAREVRSLEAQVGPGLQLLTRTLPALPGAWERKGLVPGFC